MIENRFRLLCRSIAAVGGGNVGKSNEKLERRTIKRMLNVTASPVVTHRSSLSNSSAVTTELQLLQPAISLRLSKLDRESVDYQSSGVSMRSESPVNGFSSSLLMLTFSDRKTEKVFLVSSDWFLAIGRLIFLLICCRRSPGITLAQIGFELSLN